MRILEMFNVNDNLKVKVNGNVLESSTSQRGASFGLLMAEVGRRQPEPMTEHQSSNRDENRLRNRPEARTNREDQSTRSRREFRTDDTTNTAGAAAVQNMERLEVNSCYESVVDEGQSVSKIAAIMQVPEEVVAEWLQELGMDARALTDPKSIAKMLQHALDAESLAELLTNEKFPKFYKAINEAIADAKVETKTVNAFAEGLEAVLEDGELIVTEKDVNIEISVNSTRSQATAETVKQEAELVGSLPAEIKDSALLVADDAPVSETQQMATPVVTMETVVKTEQSVTQSASSPVSAKDVVEQIVNQVKVINTGGQFTEMRLTLRPESLGDIVLRVLTQNGIVTAQFEAENQRVKEALEADFGMLRDALEEQGIKFSELSVSVRQNEDERMNQFEQARQGSRHRAESIEDVSEEAEISHHNGVIDVTA
jgi:flagellar hook-length control protein FliK